MPDSRLGRSVASDPQPGDTKIIVADGHDAGASHGCARNRARGLTSPRFTYWLTPSGKLVEEGRRYRVRWVERFRGVRSNRSYVLLRYVGKWEIDSEALDGTVGADDEHTPRGQSDADPLSDRVALRVASLDRYEVSGRGIIHVIQIPESHQFYGTPRSLVGRWVVVDGELSVVRAVETYAVAEGHPALKRPCGLLLSRGVIGDAPPRAS